MFYYIFNDKSQCQIPQGPRRAVETDTGVNSYHVSYHGNLLVANTSKNLVLVYGST